MEMTPEIIAAIKREERAMIIEAMRHHCPHAYDSDDFCKYYGYTPHRNCDPETCPILDTGHGIRRKGRNE